MKKVLLIFGTILLTAGNAFAQYDDENKQETEATDDASGFTSINDIVNEQQEVTNRNTMEKHFSNVWRRRSYVNFVYGNQATLTPKDPIVTGVDYNGGLVPEYKAQWYGSLQVGRSYRLHKKPIGNTAQICIDYTGLDLSLSHYEAENNGHNIYNSSSKDGDNYRIPWNLEKYQADVAMTLGASLTLSPFNYVKSNGLHYLQFQGYYRAGYEVSGIYLIKDENADANTSGTEHVKLADTTNILWGHGLVLSYGFTIGWKALGLGVEWRKTHPQYKSINTDTYGSDFHKFDTSVTRLYLQIRM